MRTAIPENTLDNAIVYNILSLASESLAYCMSKSTSHITSFDFAILIGRWRIDLQSARAGLWQLLCPVFPI